MRDPLPFVFLLVALTAACDSDIGGADVCTGDVRANFDITVVDSLTKFALASQASGTATTQGYQVSLVPADTIKLREATASEHAGTYSLTVSVPGYVDWTSNNVRVEKDGCHVKTRSVRAALLPASSPLPQFYTSSDETLSANMLPVTSTATAGAGSIIIAGTSGQVGRCPQIGISAQLWGRLFKVSLSHPDSCGEPEHHGITYSFVYPVAPGYYRVVVEEPWLDAISQVNKVIRVD